MTQKKNPQDHTLDIEALEAKKADLTALVKELRSQLPAAEDVVEKAEDAEAGLKSALAKGDLSISAADVAEARAAVVRAETIRDGLDARIERAKKDADNLVVPKVALLVADLLNADALTGMVRWYPVGEQRSSDARAILAQGRASGIRTGIVWEEPAKPGGRRGVTVVNLKTAVDALTRDFDRYEVTSVLNRSGRIGHVEADPNSAYRLTLAGVYPDAVPVLTKAPTYVLAFPWGTVRDVQMSEPVEAADGTRQVEVCATVIHDATPAATARQALEQMADPANPMYTQAGVCTESEIVSSVPVEGWQQGRHTLRPALQVRQVFEYRAA